MLMMPIIIIIIIIIIMIVDLPEHSHIHFVLNIGFSDEPFINSFFFFFEMWSLGYYNSLAI